MVLEPGHLVTSVAVRDDGLIVVASARIDAHSKRSSLSFFRVEVVGEGQAEQWCLRLEASSPALEGLAFSAVFLESGEAVLAANECIIVYTLNGSKIEEVARTNTTSGGCILTMAALHQRIVVGEVLRAVSTYTFNASTRSLTAETCDRGSRVVSALQLLGERLLVFADHQGLVGVCSTDLEGSLELQFACRCSHRITKFCVGRLAGRSRDTDDVFFVTAGGAVGVVSAVSSTALTQLTALEQKLSGVVSSVGSVSHQEFWGAKRGEGVGVIAQICSWPIHPWNCSNKKTWRVA